MLSQCKVASEDIMGKQGPDRLIRGCPHGLRYEIHDSANTQTAWLRFHLNNGCFVLRGAHHSCISSSQISMMLKCFD